MKSRREKYKCIYCIGYHYDRYCFRNKLYIMTKLLEENNFDVPYFVRKEESKLSLEQEDGKHLYALGSRVKPILNTYVSDLQSDMSDSETSISSLEETPNNSPKFPPKTSYFSLVFDLSSESSFPLHSSPSNSNYKGDT